MLREKLDSYECTNCGAWSHYAPPISDDDTLPQYCPYCANETLMPTLEWRADTLYSLVEV